MRKSVDVVVVKEPPKEEPDKHAGGRPTDYKDEYAEQARKLCLLGATDKEMAKYFDVAESTINNWKIAVPEFLESIRDGKENADMDVADGLHKRAMGFEYVDYQAIKVKEVMYDNGKRVSEKERVEVVPITKVEPPESKAASYWLNNRKSTRWRNKQTLVDDDDNPIPQLVVIRSQQVEEKKDTSQSDQNNDIVTPEGK